MKSTQVAVCEYLKDKLKPENISIEMLNPANDKMIIKIEVDTKLLSNAVGSSEISHKNHIETRTVET